MRSQIVLVLATVLLLCGVVAVLYAQSQGKTLQPGTDRVDLQTETWVGKRLDRTEDGPNGQKIHHYTYRVEARPTAKGLPRYIVDHRYGVTYETKGFQPGDSVTLLSANPESETDSPIWVYNVTYVGSGTRSVTFSTTGSVMTPTFMSANSETNCPGCGCDLTNCSNHDYCEECNHCPENGCVADCPGCQCACHDTCSENCDCEVSLDCPGPSGHDCETCNPKCGGEPGCYCGGDPVNGCQCSCHMVITETPSDQPEEGSSGGGGDGPPC